MVGRSPAASLAMPAVSTMAWSMMPGRHVMSKGRALVARCTVSEPGRRPMAKAVVMLRAHQELVRLARTDVIGVGRYRPG